MPKIVKRRPTGAGNQPKQQAHPAVRGERAPTKNIVKRRPKGGK